MLHHSPTAGLLRPAYAILLDRDSRSLILCIRGTHSRQDMFTSLIGGRARLLGGSLGGLVAGTLI